MTSMTQQVRTSPAYVDIDKDALMCVASTTFIGGECFIEIAITNSFDQQTRLVLHEDDAEHLGALLSSVTSTLTSRPITL